MTDPIRPALPPPPYLRGTTEPIRPIPPPTVEPDGSLCAYSVCSPTDFRARAGVPIPKRKVILVVFVPGIMGSNLRTKPGPLGQPAEIAWRPPNGAIAGITEVYKWEGRDAKKRQSLLDPDNTEVDDRGDIPFKVLKDHPLLRNRGWGTVHMDSYGDFLVRLQHDMSSTYDRYAFSPGLKSLWPHWQEVQNAKRKKWGTTDSEMPPLTDAEFKKFAQYQYPVYAVGYNWLRTCAEAAELLHQKIEGWVAEWLKAGHACDKVVLVSHSMGGLVCRAYAKAHPERVLGVVHGVQPAVGAPLAYRRMVCGTETNSPSNSIGANIAGGLFAEIVGPTPAETQPVLAVSPGPLELLPCHLHPKEWLTAGIRTRPQQPTGAPTKDKPFYRFEAPTKDQALTGFVKKVLLKLPKADPYDEIYQDMTSWYRLVDPALIDPGKKYAKEEGGAVGKVKAALVQAEQFHKNVVGNYYHPNTWAFYGHDSDYLSYGRIWWEGFWQEPDALTEQAMATAKAAHSDYPWQAKADFGPPGPLGRQRIEELKILQAQRKGLPVSERNVEVTFNVDYQDAPGDGTVNWQSGAAPGEYGIKQLFRTTGYDHQGAFNNEAMRLLTLHLICKIVQEAP